MARFLPNHCFVLPLVLLLAATALPAHAVLDGQPDDPTGDYRLLFAASPDPVQTNGVITYTATVTSDGPGPVQALLFRLDAPAATRFANFGAPDGWVCSTPPLDAAGSIECTAASFEAGTQFFVAAYRVDEGVPGGSRISAVAELTADSVDPVPDNNRLVEETDVLSPSRVALRKSGPAQAIAGAALRYRLRLTNSSTSAQADLAGDEFVDQLPSPLTLVGATASAGLVTLDLATRRVRWNGRIGAASSVDIDIDASTPASTAAGSVLQNQAEAQFDADGDGVNDSTVPSDDPQLPGAADPTLATVITRADLSLLLGTTSSEATIGRVVDFELSALNPGPSNARDVVLSTAVPEGSMLVEFAAPAGWTCVQPDVGTDGGIVCQRPQLAPGNASFRLAVRPHADHAAPMLELPARIRSGTTDPQLDNNDDLLQVPLTPGVRLQLLKAVSGNYAPGGVARYVITLSNVGTLPQFDNPGPELVDDMPPQLRIIGSQADSGRLTILDDGTRLEWDGDLPAGESVSLRIEALIDPATPIGTVIENLAQAVADIDGDGVNEFIVSSIDPQTGLEVGPTGFGVIDPALYGPNVVPAGSAVTAVLLATLMLLLGAGMLRRTAGKQG